jgi:hypothetical protein
MAEASDANGGGGGDEVSPYEQRAAFVRDLLSDDGVAAVNFTRNGYRTVTVETSADAPTGVWQLVVARARGLGYDVTHTTTRDGRHRLVATLDPDALADCPACGATGLAERIHGPDGHGCERFRDRQRRRWSDRDA